MENKCGCWAGLTRRVRGSFKSSASNHSANTIPRTSLVYDAGSPFFSLSSLLLSCKSLMFMLVFKADIGVCDVYIYFTFCDVSNFSSLLSHSLTFF